MSMDAYFLRDTVTRPELGSYERIADELYILGGAGVRVANRQQSVRIENRLTTAHRDDFLCT